MKLTIGMASYDNFTEVWFTVQALVMYQDLLDTEILIIDNYGNNESLENFINSAGVDIRVVKHTDVQGTAYAKNKVFEEARGDWVLVIDSHVMLPRGVIAKLKKWIIGQSRDDKNLYHGPLLYDCQKATADAMEPVWRGTMFGIWRNQHVDFYADPYEIPMHGMGLFVCKRKSWAGFNKSFKGFGGEEGYIHEKFRQLGGKIILLPFMQWLHHFTTTSGGISTAKHLPRMEDILFNYRVGWAELGMNTVEMEQHFKAEGMA